MKYCIFYLIEGKAKRYHQKLVKEVGPKFGERYMIENPLPAHITLKYFFETSRTKELEKLLREFVKKQKQSKMEIDGFSNFDRRVVFLKIKPSKQAIKTRKELVNGIMEINGIKLNELDIKFKPHLTIAYGNTKKSFSGIWNYVKKLDKPKFNLKLDNITLIKKSGKYWKVHKEFKIKL
ncbi:MAG: 2'-5' RNA ligase family protein [Candidatus Pacearchaeota archaeon]|nr:2'-5' RNA ligase family protein [Candidatus Pacearchaeota archaeon]